MQGFTGSLMRIKSSVCVFLMLLFLFGQNCGLGASSTNSFSFQGAGVDIELIFPEEAHPIESITHNLTITANTALTLENFTIIIRVLVNSSWQQVSTDARTGRDIVKDEKLPINLKFTLPHNADEKLYCFIHVLTDKTSDPLSYTFYTTHVRKYTYSELMSEYNELLTNYSDRLTEFGTLLESYNDLAATYGVLNSTYNSLLKQYTTSQSNYNSLLSSHYLLEANYNSLNQTCKTLENEIDDLHQKTDSSKIEIINTRNLTYLFVGITIALIALIIYIKKKKPEPYVVIRKETVAVKPTENP
jgi:hypothetical protein